MVVLRRILLIVATTWLALSGVIIPDLYQLGSYVAMSHSIILAFLALALIVWLTKPEGTGSRRRG